MKLNKSGPAIFMYILIGIMLFVSSCSFFIYYSDLYKSQTVLWMGIVSFTIMYHLWARIIMGNVTRLFKDKIKWTAWWFKERKCEKKLYKFLKVKKWKGKALTYNPELFSLKEYSLEEIAGTMTKAETDHWINEIISLSTIAFGFIWGSFWIFIISAVFAMVFDAQFIIIQRYNRPRVLRIIDKQNSLKR